MIVVEAVRSHGWTTQTEVTGLAPDGEQWRADVLAQKGNTRVAVEIQWSRQTNDETLRRQERYKQCGIRGLWLLRQPGFPVAHSLPAVRVVGNPHEGFEAIIPDCWTTRMNAHHQQNHMPLRDFLDAAFEGRFRFGVPLNVEAAVTILGAERSCWACGADTRIVTGVHVAFGPHDSRFTIPDFDEHPEPLRIVLKHVPPNLNIGKIKRRFSKTQRKAYVSNGCAHCDKLQGEFFEHDVCSAEEPLCHFAITLSEQWRHAIVKREGFEPGWGVYNPVSRP